MELRKACAPGSLYQHSRQQGNHENTRNTALYALPSAQFDNWRRDLLEACHMAADLLPVTHSNNGAKKSICAQLLLRGSGLLARQSIVSLVQSFGEAYSVK